MFKARDHLVRFSQICLNLQHRKRLCNATPPGNKQKSYQTGNNNSNGYDRRDLEVYRDLENLDFAKAAKILFSTPPKKKRFGLDFHLVQLFFALMPSLAVYLVAQYARHEMRKMDADLEQKKKAEEEQRVKEVEAAIAKEKKAEEEKEVELLKVKERLDVLEGTLKDIVVETKKRSIEATENQPKTQEATTGQPEKHEIRQKTEDET
ncbi:unnamed protein product [Amaranthus hypochondriacus]